MTEDDKSEPSSFASDFNAELESSEQEGVSFYDYVVQTCGRDAPQNFS